MVKLGVIGLGHMGGYHSSVSNSLQTAQLIATADPSEANWNKVKGAHVIKAKDYKEWLDLVDGVIIAVPTAHHYEVAKECLTRGKHVLLEKPLTNTLAQAQELMDLAQKNQCTLHVGHVERFNGAIQELKKIIDVPKLIECHRMGPFVARVAKDSVVLDLMIHDIDLVLNIVQAPVKKVQAQGTKVYSDSCDIATVMISFENGTIATISSSRASQIKKRTMSVHQKNEFIHLDFGTQDLSIHRHASSSVQLGTDQLKYRQEASIEHVFVYKDNPLKLEIENFVSAIKTGNDRLNPDQDLRSLQITFEIERLLGLR
jgi:predicted dehydrogenase